MQLQTAPANTNAAQSRHPQLPLTPGSTATAVRIILAEEDADVRSSVQRLLQPHYNVEAFATSTAALQAASKNPPDIILSGLMTREIGGLKWLRALRSDEKLRTTPIILLATSDVDEGQPDATFDLADDFVIKPFGARELLARVATQIQLKQARLAAEQSAAALHESENRYRNLLGSIDEGFCIIEPIFDHNKKPVDYRFLEINPSFEKHTGLHNACGKRMRELEPHHEEHWFELYGRIALTGEPERFEYPALKLNRWFDGYAYRIGDGPEPKVGIIFNDITQRKLAEQSASEKEERLRAALSASETGTFRWNIRTNELDWDESLDHLFGLPPGQTVRSLETFIARVHPDDRPGVIDRCQRCAQAGADFDMEFRVTWPDGSVHWLDDKGKTFFDKDRLPLYMTGACIEITARKANEDALLKSRQRFDIVKDAAQVGFWFCDLPFDKLTWDNRVKEHFWFTPETDVTIELFYDHLHPDDRERTRKAIEQSIENHTGYDIEYRTVSPSDGRVKWIRAIGQGFYDDKGQPIRFDGVTLDITDRKQAQENLEHIVAERTEKLRETMGELESYSYSIVHDMRAPLRSMQGFSSLLRDEFADKLGDDGAMYLQRISTSAQRMDRLIQDVLSFSRVTRSDLTLEPVNTHKLVHDIVETYSNLRAYKDCIHIDGPLPIVRGNEAGLTQCFSNLIGNAVKFVAPGTQPSIRIWAELADGSARIFVEDKGIGIAEIAHPRIFQLFQRANVDYEGTGIGLSVVKKTVERMGGSVGFRSQLGKGSTFWLELKQA